LKEYGVSVLTEDDVSVAPLNDANCRNAPGSTMAFDICVAPLKPPTCVPDQLGVACVAG
jgi:hypothetical protein